THTRSESRASVRTASWGNAMRSSSLFVLLLASVASAQQLPSPYVQRLNAEPFHCKGPDLALIPCGRARIADECRFRAAHLADCPPAPAKAAAAKAALDACAREADPERGGNMANAFATYDRAVAAAAAASSPGCKWLRGVPAAGGGALDLWN